MLHRKVEQNTSNIVYNSSTNLKIKHEKNRKKETSEALYHRYTMYRNSKNIFNFLELVI